MRLCSSVRALKLLVIIYLTASVANAVARGTDPNGTLQSGVVLTELYPPVYPPLARQARIMGDVVIQVGIRQDGSIASLAVISGHAMLQEAALESALKSTFECKACAEGVTSYALTYTFTFALRDDVDCSVRRLRAAKCLYLWKCGYWWQALRTPEIIRSQGHITILADSPCVEPSTAGKGD